MPERRSGPPRLAVELLRRRLPAEIAEAFAGDLEEEYRGRVRPHRGRFLADLWFWWQLLSVRAGALRRAQRRVRAVRPTLERNSPAGAADADAPGALSMLASDLRYAVRRLALSPGFTAVAVLSLALGIGANTAVFSVVNAALLRGLPVENRGELVEIYTSEADGFAYATSSHADYSDVRQRLDVFRGVVGTRTFIARLDRDGAPRVVFGELVSWDYFPTLGVPLALGRSFTAEEDATPGSHPVTILGHRTWVRDFGRDPAILGRSVVLNGRAYTVVGVADERFTGSMPALVTAFYLPLMMTDAVMNGDQLGRRGSRSMFLKGRLADSTTVGRANEALGVLAASLAEAHPETNENRVFTAVPSSDVALHPAVDRVLAPIAVMLLAVVGLVLAVACANLASFLLARAEDRRREIAVRLALGAGRLTLVRQLVVESALLALAGGLAGVAVARGAVDALLAVRPPLPVPIDLSIPLDARVLLFTGVVSLLAGVTFGLVPALQSTRPDVASTLKNEARGSGSRRGRRVRGVLVGAQTAFSFLLLVAAGLFLRSLQKAQSVDPGFDTGPAAIVWPMPELSGYESDQEVRAFEHAFEAALLAHPRVASVTRADRLPLGIAVQTAGYVLPGVPSMTPDGDHDIDNASVGLGYFETMGVPMEEGRAFLRDDLEGESVAIVSRAFAARFYPGQSLVGRTIEKRGGRSLRIVGVAADTKVRTLGESPRPYVYELEGQASPLGGQWVVRGPATGDELVAIARAALTEVDPDVVLFEEPKTMSEHLALLLFAPRMAALLMTTFGTLALLLAAIGIYGVVSHAVAGRRREVGIRLSLGATPSEVVGLAWRGGMVPVVLGGAVGIAGAAALAWVLSDFLFGIGPYDIATFVAIPAVLGSAAFLAAWIPARRMGHVDPVQAMRTE